MALTGSGILVTAEESRNEGPDRDRGNSGDSIKIRNEGRGRRQIFLRATSASAMTPPLFATGWRPQLRDNLLRPCPLLQPLIDNDERPSVRRDSDKAWLPGSYSSLLAEVPYAVEGITESVRAVWRLHCVEEEGGKSDSWVDHLEAWLVRELYLCFFRD